MAPLVIGTDNYDQSGELKTTGSGGGGASNVNIAQVAGAAPTLSNPLPVELSDGANALGTLANPIRTSPATSPGTQPVSGTVTANQGTAAALAAGWPVTAGEPAENTAAWTSATPGGTTLVQDVRGLNTVVVTLNIGSTITGGVLTFEVSDTQAFTNAYVITGLRSDALSGGPISTFTLVANSNFAMLFNVTGYSAFRVRLSTAITGTATVNLGIQARVGGGPNVSAITNVNTVTSVTTVATVTNANVRSPQAAGAYGDNNANLLSSFCESNNTSRILATANFVYGGNFSGTADANRQGWSKRRTPTVFKTVSVAASASGNTAVWTPQTGNKFRLLGFQITGQGLSATVSAAITVKFQDSTTDIGVGIYDNDVPAVANLVSGVNQISGGAIQLGEFGVLSAAANNVLNFNISAAGAGTTGTYRVTVWGTEE